MRSVFRKSSMEKLQSPDRLDCMLKVTTPMSWIGIMAAGLLAFCVLVWAFTGTIPTMASAKGFLVGSYNTNTLFSGVAGRISEIQVEEGNLVHKGENIMTVLDAKGNTVKTPAQQTGFVSAILVEEGDFVTPNMELLRISPNTSNALSVICYVGLDVSKQLQEGMKAEIYLNADRSGTYGHMNAIVTNIDSYVASNSAMNELLGADGQMMYMLTAEGPLVAVTCQLKTDYSTASGYFFSSEQAKDLQITSGEQVSVQFILSEEAPIAKVFPGN